jgi:hypothetical protein
VAPVQKAAAWVFGVSLAALIPFWIVKGAQPSGHAVLWVLYGVASASALIWLLAAFLRRRRDAQGLRYGTQPAPPSGPPAMFHVGHLGEGRFTRGRGRLLSAGRVDTLYSDENVGPEENEQQAEAFRRRNWFLRIWQRATRSHRHQDGQR